MAIVSRDTATGYELPPISNQMNLEKWVRRDELLQRAFPRFHAAANIHTDVEAAKKEGLSAPVAGGPYLAAHISRMMLLSFGEGWIQGGKMEIKFIKPVYPPDFITARGVVTDKQPEGAQIRFLCEIWIERQGGEKVVVGSASAVVS